MNIFHTNINGLESKLDNLHGFISGSQPKLDILAITETSEQEKVGFLHNVEIKGYKIFHTASKTSKGGTAVYVNENVNSIERIDLNILHDEFEGKWVEIKNKHSKNIICGCIHKHPHYNFKEFFQYLEMCLSKLNKENKEIFLAGDFNFELLKTGTDTNTQNFYDLLCSYGTLPQITQPTTVTPNTATIIDNIFTNNITDDIICGNILLTFSEHLSQFVSVNRGKIDYKKINIMNVTIPNLQ